MDCIEEWGGDYSYTIPYTGNYEVTLSGSQGSAYSNSSGGYGYTIKQVIRLQRGTVIRFSIPNKPTGYTTNGSVITVPSGNDGVFYVGGTEKMRAGGGAGYVNNGTAPSGITSVKTAKRTYSVHWHSGLNRCPGATGCYYNYHEHDGCPEHLEHDGCVWNGPCDCEADSPGHGHWDHHYVNVMDCNSMPLNRTGLNCGYTQGQIYTINNVVTDARSCSGSYSSAVLTNSGHANFTIKLVEQQNMNYARTNVKVPYYTRGKCNLILNDYTVVYFKRP